MKYERNTSGNYVVRPGEEWIFKAKHFAHEEIKQNIAEFNEKNLDMLYWHMAGLVLHRKAIGYWFWRVRKCK